MNDAWSEARRRWIADVLRRRKSDLDLDELDRLDDQELADRFDLEWQNVHLGTMEQMGHGKVRPVDPGYVHGSYPAGYVADRQG